MNSSQNCDKTNLAPLFLRPFKLLRNAFVHEFRRQMSFTGKNGSNLNHHLKIRAKIEVREHLYCVSLRRRVYTIVHHSKNRERYWVFCGKLRTNSQHHDIVTTPFQKAVATKRFVSHLQARNTRYLI